MRLLLFAFLLSAGTFLTGFSQVASIADGDWDETSTWDCGCVPDFNDDVITIGHIVTIPSGLSVTVDQIEFVNDFSGFTGSLIVAAGGTMIVNNGAGDDIRLLNDFSTLASLQVAGTLRLNVGATIVEDDYGNLGIGAMAVTPDTYSVLNGGLHMHFTGTGVDAIPNAQWQAGSTCRVIAQGAGTPVITPSTSFYNFIWDGTNAIGTGQSALYNLASNLRDVNGDLTILGTGTTSTPQVLQLGTTTAYTLSVDGDFIIQGNSRVTLTTTGGVTLNVGTLSAPSDFIISSAATSANAITFNVSGTTNLNVFGNFNKSGASSVTMLAGISGSTALNLRGNFSHTGGTLTKNSTASAVSINFIGSGTSSTYVSTATLSNDIDFTVASGKTLDLDTYSITGTGDLTVNGTLQVGSTNSGGAIQAGQVGGNLMNGGGRNFTSTASIVYNGDAKQFMSSGHPSTVATTISNGSNVELVEDVTIGDLTLNASTIEVEGNTLTFDGTLTANSGSFINVLSSSSLAFTGSDAFGTLPLSGSSTILNLTLNRSGITIALGRDLSIDGTFNQLAGNLNFSGFALTINDDYTRTAGNLLFNSTSTLIVRSSGTTADLPLGSTTIGTFILNRSTGVNTSNPLTVQTEIDLQNGVFGGAGSITMANGSHFIRGDGSTSKTVSISSGTYDVTYNGSIAVGTVGNPIGNELPSSATALGDLNIENTVTLSKNITVNDTLALTSGSFDASTHTLTLEGNVVSNTTGTFSSATIIFNGTTTISGTQPLTFNGFTVNASSSLNFGPATGDATNINIGGNITSSGTISGGLSNVVFNGNSTITHGTGATVMAGFNNVQITGTLILNTVDVQPNPDNNLERIEVTGDWVVSGGTFTPNFSSVNFTGVNQSITAGSQSFYTITVANTGTATLNSAVVLTNDLRINTGGTFDVNVNSNFQVSIGGDFVFNGTYLARQGTVLFNGGVIQSISSSGSTALSLYNVTINKTSAGFNIQSPTQVQNLFTISSATTVTADNDELTLLSTASRTAKVTQLPTGASIAGRVIVQRHMPNTAGTKNYHYMAPPVTNTNVPDWDVELPISRAYYYDESFVPTSNAESKYRTLSLSAAVANGRGYSVYVNSSNAVTFDSRGTLAQGQIQVPVTSRTADDIDGWNLIGNPYPSTIDWDNVTVPTGVFDAIYFTDNFNNGGLGAGSSVAYVDGVGTPASYSGLISQGQAFWVKASGTAFSTNIVFQEDDKTTTGATFFRERTVSDILRITVAGNSQTDEAVVRLREGATDQFDGSYDAYKFPFDSAASLKISTLVGTSRMAINSFGNLTCDNQLPIKVENTAPGGYFISFTGLTTFNEPVPFYLFDTKLDTAVQVVDSASYAFVISEGDNAAERFFLTIGLPMINTDVAVTASDICVGETEATVTLASSEVNVSYAVQFADGESERLAGNGDPLTFTIPASELAAGMNEFEIIGYPSACASFPLSTTAVIHVLSADTAQVANAANVCNEGSATLTLTGATEGGSYQWFSNIDDVEPIVGETGATFTTPVITESIVYYAAAVNRLGCAGPRIAVPIDVTKLDDASITINGDELISNHETGNEWLLDGTVIGTSQTLVVFESGLYELRVTKNGCVTSTTREHSITGAETGAAAFSVHPNPTEGNLVITASGSEYVTAKIVDVNGNIHQYAQFVQRGSKAEAVFNVSPLAAGVYFVQAEGKKKSSFQKIIKK